MITSATPSQVSVNTAPQVLSAFSAENQQTVFKPLAPVVKSDALAAGDKERYTSSPLSREISAFGYAEGSAQTLVTYNKNGRLNSSQLQGAGNSSKQSGEADDKAQMQSDEVDERKLSDDDSGALPEDHEAVLKEKHEEQKQLEIRSLAARDREVRAHEQAHAAIGGSFAGAPKYQFERGPDGVNYAVGGEVPIDVSPAATPEATINKMQAVRRAALAPAEPSPQDRRVAQEAIAVEASARQSLMQEQRDEAQSVSNKDDGSASSAPKAQDEPDHTDAKKQSDADYDKPSIGEPNSISSRSEQGNNFRSISIIA